MSDHCLLLQNPCTRSTTKKKLYLLIINQLKGFPVFQTHIFLKFHPRFLTVIFERLQQITKISIHGWKYFLYNNEVITLFIPVNSMRARNRSTIKNLFHNSWLENMACRSLALFAFCTLKIQIRYQSWDFNPPQL